MLAYLGPIAPRMIKPKVEINNPNANAQGVSNKISIEKAASAKQRSKTTQTNKRANNR